MKTLFVTVIISVLAAVALTGCNKGESTGGQFAPDAKAEPGAKAPAPAP